MEKASFFRISVVAEQKFDWLKNIWSLLITHNASCKALFFIISGIIWQIILSTVK